MEIENLGIISLGGTFYNVIKDGGKEKYYGVREIYIKRDGYGKEYPVTSIVIIELGEDDSRYVSSLFEILDKYHEKRKKLNLDDPSLC